MMITDLREMARPHTVTGRLRGLLVVLAIHMSRMVAADGSLSTTATPLSSLEVREYCEWETFNASCSSSIISSTNGDVITAHEDHVIVIRTARYGRMHVGRCVTQSYGNIGCGADVTAELSRACSGRVRCSVAVISLYGRRSCPMDFTSYLEASYECIRVTASATDDVCGHNDVTGLPLSTVLLTSSSGLLASRLSPTACPWTIRVEPFQQIIVSMTDFDVVAGEPSTAAKPASAIGGVHMHDCTEYAVIADVITSSVSLDDSATLSSSSNMSLCGGDNVYRGRRDEVVFRSRGHVIQIYIRSHKSFLISYEAVGCPEISTPPNAWSRRTGSQHAVVQCNSSTEAWFLTCRGTSWIGTVGNCSTMYQHASGGSDEETWPSFGAVQRFPIGVLIVVAFGVAIGVVVGVLLLVSVLTCMRHRRASKAQNRSNCANISSSYATVLGYYGNVDKNAATPRYDVMTGSSIVLEETAAVQQSTVSDHTTISSVAMATGTELVNRGNEGVTNLSADDLLKSVEQRTQSSSRKSRSSCSLVSLFPSSSDCFSSSACVPKGQPIKSSVPFIATRPFSGLQPSQRFIMPDGTKVELGQTPSEEPGPIDTIPNSDVLPSARWTLKPERRRRPTTSESSAHHQKALTPGNSYHRSHPTTDKTRQRSRTYGQPDDIPPIWNTVRRCPQEYDVFFRSHDSSNAADRDPDVLQNCALCRHASSVGAFQVPSEETAHVQLYHNTDRF